MGRRSTSLHEAEASFDDGDGGGDGGLGAKDAWAKVGKGEIFRTEQIALGGGPTAFGTDGECDDREDAGRCDVA